MKGQTVTFRKQVATGKFMDRTGVVLVEKGDCLIVRVYDVNFVVLKTDVLERRGF